MSKIFEFNGKTEADALRKVIKSNRLADVDKKINYYNVFYKSLADANLLKPEGYSPYFKGANIKFPAQFNRRVAEAKELYVKAYLKEATFYADTEIGKKEWAKKLAQITLDYALAHNGASIFPGTGLAIRGGYAVGGVAKARTVSSLTYEDILLYILENYEDYFRFDNYVIGVWYDVKNNYWALDVSDIIFGEEVEAQNLASARKQKAYYDLYQDVSKKPDGTLYTTEEAQEDPDTSDASTGVKEEVKEQGN